MVLESILVFTVSLKPRNIVLVVNIYVSLALAKMQCSISSAFVASTLNYLTEKCKKKNVA